MPNICWLHKLRRLPMCPDVPPYPIDCWPSATSVQIQVAPLNSWLNAQLSIDHSISMMPVWTRVVTSELAHFAWHAFEWPLVTYHLYCANSCMTLHWVTIDHSACHAFSTIKWPLVTYRFDVPAGLVVCSVDNMPAQMPLEATKYFGDILMPWIYEMV